MFLQVRVQVALLPELLRTALVHAHERLLARVDHAVHLQPRLAVERGVAQRALERPQVRMPVHVVVQLALRLEPHRAPRLRARERPFTRVNAHVRLQVALLVEPFPTVNATERLLTSLYTVSTYIL